MKIQVMNVCFLVLFTIANTFAGTTGKLAGRVTDKKTGEPLIGATVIIQTAKPAAGAITDKDGYYNVLNISPGWHEVLVKYLGYVNETHKVFINVDQTKTLNVLLGQDAVQGEEIVVLGERIIVQRDQSSTIQKTYAEDLASLPVSSVSDVLQLQTGVVNTGALHIRGGRAGEVGYYIDGYRVEDPLFNNVTAQVNNQAIQEMELLSGTFNAEYGNALSGVVNIVTKENAEKFRANVTYKRTSMGMESYSTDLNERVFEGTFSGPLWEKSPFGFMVSGKKTDADNYYYSGLTRSNNGVLESIDFSKDKPFGFNDQLSLVGKLSWIPMGSAKLTLLDNYSKRKWRNYSHGMRFVPDSTYLNTSENNLIGVNFRNVISDNFIYDLRVSYYKYHYLHSVNGLSKEQYPFPYGSTFSNSYFLRTGDAPVSYEEQTTKTFTIKGDVTWQYDNFNLVKSGAEIRLNDLDYYYNSNPGNANDQRINQYVKSPTDGSAYIQDKIEFQTIILNLGLRFDYFAAKTAFYLDPIDKTATEDTKVRTSLSPRLGISYPVRENLVFHFSYGQFFQRPEYQTLYNNLERNFANRGNTLFGSPTLEPEKTSSYELGVMMFIDKSVTGQVTFFSKKIENLIGIGWVYEPHAYAYYINEDFASVKGFEMSVKTRFHNISWVGNYTYSIAKGSSSSQQERYSNVFNHDGGIQSLRFLPLDFDQRHTANMQLTFDFADAEGPFELLPSVFQNTTFSLVGQYGSGLPYTFNPARALFVPEANNSRLPYTLTFDLYARKEFKTSLATIGVYFDVRNLFDRKNVISVYSDTGLPDRSTDKSPKNTPDFQQDPTNYASPRTIYFGVDFNL
ncbi:MAG: TonB-dependent receptor [Ignavibacteria bacterium]|nr:TonB-dependent receptor [Ignavibacteria bacterium]